MSAFDPGFDALPPQLPIFPLTGVLLLPRGELPLNIFEPRYLHMTEDALAADRMIGMIQPTEHESSRPNPPVYRTGCAGRIVSFQETEDGRFLLTLKGVCRFDVEKELPLKRGYRPVVADWSRHRDDLTVRGEGIDRGRLLASLKSYFSVHGISADWKAIEASADERLVTCLSMICPFEASEKQALLEAPNLPERSKILTTLVEMSAHAKSPGRAGPQ
ncbi:MAG: peptidase S16 [Alphaproteobacteria bacterium]|nr:peptidase S16 [Alphaproteobacteria bacterium]